MRLRAFLLVALVGLAVVSAAGLVAGAESSVERPADHTNQWEWLHGRAAAKDVDSCQECHVGDSCSTCHLAEWPHEDGFLEVHGEAATERDGKGCYFCHRTSYCDGCHGGVRMPHESEYVNTHFAEPTPVVACMRCHVEKDCDSCHESHASHRTDGAIR